MNPDNSSEEKKLQTHWTLLTMVRELIALGRGVLPTYFKAIQFSRQIMPDIMNEHSPIVQREHKPELVREYEQRATIESRRRAYSVPPIELLEEDIRRYENLLDQKEDDQVDLIEKTLAKLRSIRPLFKPRVLGEDLILRQDLLKL